MVMASHNPAIWDELLASTMHNVRGTFTDNIFKKNPLLEHFLSNGRVRIADGGYSIIEPLLFNEGQADAYGEWDVLTVKPVNTLTAAQYEWKQLFATIAISGLDEAQNNGKEQRINLLEAKIKQAEMTLRLRLAKMLYGTYVPTPSTNGWNSLDVLIDSTTATGGITPASEAWWASYEVAVGSVAAAAFEAALRLAVMTTSDNGGDQVDAIYTGPTLYSYYESTLTPQVRFTDTDKANLGFRNLLFENVPIMWDAECPATTIYGINSEYVGLVIHKDRNFTQSPFTANLTGSVSAPATGTQTAGTGAPAANAGGLGATAAEALDARVSFITTYGNATIRNRRRCFKLTGVVGT